jgi:hypothetical protein
MKRIFSISIIIVSIAFSSCGHADKKDNNKEITADTLQNKSVDTGAVKIPPEENPGKGSTTRSNVPSPSSGKHDKNVLLANIDKYLVSTLAYPDPGTVTIQNTLTDITIEKAYIEVNLVKDNGETRTDYFTVINMEPGDSKVIKITNPMQGTTASSHVVKLKSIELTDGELISVGSKYIHK